MKMTRCDGLVVTILKLTNDRLVNGKLSIMDVVHKSTLVLIRSV